MPGFQAQRTNWLLETNIAGDFKLKSMLIYYSEKLRALKNYIKFTMSVF
jgi:hypothetical protein